MPCPYQNSTGLHTSVGGSWILRNYKYGICYLPESMFFRLIISFKLLQVSIQVTKPDDEAEKEQRHDAQNRAKAEKHVIKRVYRGFLK